MYTKSLYMYPFQSVYEYILPFIEKVYTLYECFWTIYTGHSILIGPNFDGGRLTLVTAVLCSIAHEFVSTHGWKTKMRA